MGVTNILVKATKLLPLQDGEKGIEGVHISNLDIATVQIIVAIYLERSAACEMVRFLGRTECGPARTQQRR